MQPLTPEQIIKDIFAQEQNKPTRRLLYTEEEKDELVRRALISGEGKVLLIDPIPQGILPEYDRDGYDGPLFIYNDVKDT